MRKPALVVVGVVVALAGLLFTLQGVGVITGSAMSNTAFWAVAGPIIIVLGAVLAVVGVRGRAG
jgi:hypothetical protein